MKGKSPGYAPDRDAPMRPRPSGARCVHHQQRATTRRLNAANLPLEHLPAQQTFYFFGGLIMMCAPAVPGDISHGPLSLALVDSPVDWVVAKGT